MKVSFSCMEISYFHENDNFMHENDISMYKTFAPGMIFSPQKCSWEVELYTTVFMEYSPMKTFGQNFNFHVNEKFVFMDEN